MPNFFSDPSSHTPPPTKNLLRPAPPNNGGMSILKMFSVFFPIEHRPTQIKRQFKPSSAFGDGTGSFGTAFDTT